MRKIIIYSIVLLVIVSVLLPSMAWAEYVDNGDGTVTDTETGLMWQQGTAENKMYSQYNTMDWENAKMYCQDMNLAGYDDWYLPSKSELMSLRDESYKPTIDPEYFPDTMSSNYWSSTSVSKGYAKWVSFIYDYYLTHSMQTKSSSYYVRAVRSGQSGSFDDLVISAPTQGNSWNIGEEQLIKWDSKKFSNKVKILLSREGGREGTFEVVTSSTANDGEYAWTPGLPASVNCVLKIESVSNSIKYTQQGLFCLSALAPSQAEAKPTNGTYPLTVNFTCNFTGEISSFIWDFGDGSNSTEQDPSHTYDSPGQYSAVYKIKNPEGKTYTSSPITVTVHNKNPVAQPGSMQTVCSNEQVVLDGSVPTTRMGKLSLINGAR